MNKITAVKAIPIDSIQFEIPNSVKQNTIKLTDSQLAVINTTDFIDKHLSVVKIKDEPTKNRMGEFRTISVSWANDYFSQAMKDRLDKLKQPHHLVLYNSEKCGGDAYLLRSDDCGYSFEYDTDDETINVSFSMQSINSIFKL